MRVEYAPIWLFTFLLDLLVAGGSEETRLLITIAIALAVDHGFQTLRGKTGIALSKHWDRFYSGRRGLEGKLIGSESRD